MSEPLSYQQAYFQNYQRNAILVADTPYVRRHLMQVMVAADLQPGQRLLEIGAGLGRFSHLLTAQGLRVVANDLSAELLTRLRLADGTGKIQTLACDAVDLPSCIDAPFARVVGFFMLHHMPDLDGFFQMLGNCLLPGARVAFCEPNAYSPLFYLQIALTPGMTWQGDGGVLRMRPSLLLHAMTNAGFEKIQIGHYGFFPPFLANRRWCRTLEEHLEKIHGLEPFRSFLAISAQWPE